MRKSRTVLRKTLVNQNRERGIRIALAWSRASYWLTPVASFAAGPLDALRGLAAIVVAQEDILQARLVGGDVHRATRHRHTQYLAKVALHGEAQRRCRHSPCRRGTLGQCFEATSGRGTGEGDLDVVVAPFRKRAQSATAPTRPHG